MEKAVEILGLRINKSIAKFWLGAGLFGAVFFVGLWAFHASRQVLLAWAIVGIFHWTAGVSIHVLWKPHIEVVNRDIWGVRNVQRLFYSLCLPIAVVSALGYVHSLRDTDGHAFAWLLATYLSFIWWAANKLEQRTKTQS